MRASRRSGNFVIKVVCQHCLREMWVQGRQGGAEGPAISWGVWCLCMVGNVKVLSRGKPRMLFVGAGRCGDGEEERQRFEKVGEW